jgi:acetyl esterase/lipase
VAQPAKQPPTQPRLVEGDKALRGVEYAKPDGKPQRLDLYLPEKSEGPLPLIIWIHGGAWMGGDKYQCPAVYQTTRGYAVASINYRLSREAKWPAQIYDCKAAVRWLRAHAKEYNLDPDRFGVWGSSAGGHLVAMLGASGDVKELEGEEGNPGVSSRVQAVCDWFGPTDFTVIGRFPSNLKHDAPDSPESKLLGGPIHENEEKAKTANPITYITKDDPPFLIMHGDRDMTVPFNQSEILNEALKAAGVWVKFEPVKGAGHGFGGPEVMRTVNEFFDEKLKGEK